MHPSSAKLQHISDDISLDKSSLLDVSRCSVCLLAKQCRLPFPHLNNMSSAPFGLVQMDIWGPFSVESVEGYKYFLTIVDDNARLNWIYMLKYKSDVSVILPSFVKFVRTQYNANIKMIRSDNAQELVFPKANFKSGKLPMHIYSVQVTCHHTRWNFNSRSRAVGGKRFNGNNPNLTSESLVQTT